ncbi:MAG: Glycine betaine/choline-binding protein of an ABC-type transport system [Frankiales bacterium]|nr:Glycine betaine/choline-binding protein of an ABC-type transport system [Frankiales bacterium]
MRARSSLVALAAAIPLLLAGCSDSGKATVTSSSSGKPSNSAGDVLVVLPDDLKLQTVDNVVPVVRTSKVSPALTQALDKVSAALTTADLIGLNKLVDVDRKAPAQVASDYATSKSLATGVSGGSGKIVVGAANFGESQILANLYVLALKAAGFDASVKPVTNREVYEPALEHGQLDAFPEYVGTLTEFLNKKANGPTAPAKASGDLAATVAALKTLATPKGLSVLTPAAAADQNAFAVTKNFATANNLTKLSDLKNVKTQLILGGPPECPTRPFCQLGLQQKYGLTFSSFVSLDTGGPLTKTALKTGKIQVGLVFSSDGSLGTL